MARIGKKDNWVLGSLGPLDDRVELIGNVLGHRGSLHLRISLGIRNPSDALLRHLRLCRQEIVPSLAVLDSAIESVARVGVGRRDKESAETVFDRGCLSHCVY